MSAQKMKKEDKSLEYDEYLSCKNKKARERKVLKKRVARMRRKQNFLLEQ